MAGAPKLRLWPLGLLLVIDLIWVFWLWRGEVLERQNILMATMGVQLLMVFLAGIHLLFFARLSGRARLRWLMGGIAATILAVATLQIREVSGDVVPILAWRWSQPPEARLANSDQLADASTVAAANAGPAYPQFLGPNGNGILNAPNLASNWTEQPPQEVWRIDIGMGWSGFAVSGKLAITQEQRGEKEMTTCYSLDDGHLIWAQGHQNRYESIIAGDGPRATPSISDGRVFPMGAMGHLRCLSLDKGALLWEHDLKAEYGARSPEWGFAGSPTIVDNAVLINAGGDQDRLLLAFDKNTGDFLWSSGNDKAGYSSPQIRTLAGQQVAILLNHSSVTYHRIDDGQLLLSEPWKQGRPNVANPLVLPGDRVLVSSGYGVGAALYQIESRDNGFAATKSWENLRLKAKFANFVYRGDYVYGLDDGILTCIAIADGKRQWKSGRYGHGQILLVGDKLLLQSEKGELHLLEAQPNQRIELTSIPVLNGKAWNTMALVGDLLIMRNHRQAVCLRLPIQVQAAKFN